MVEVGGKALLEHTVQQLRAAGVTEIVVVGGYRSDRIAVPGIKLEVNPRFATTNILASLFAARRHLKGALLYLYADVLFDPGFLSSFLVAARTAEANIVLAVDVEWRAAYDGRLQHPVSEAELVTVRDGRVVEAGKHIPAEAAYGEWCGLAQVSPAGTRALVEAYRAAERTHLEKGENPFPHAAGFDQAYVTDLLSQVANEGGEIRVCAVRGGWAEIDTPEDLVRVRRRGWIAGPQRDEHDAP